MKTGLVEYLNNAIMEDEIADLKKEVKGLKKETADAKKAADDAQKQADDAQAQAKEADKEANKAEESIKSEDDFRDYAHNKGKKVFGDKCDMDRIDKMVDGLISKYKEDADNNQWGKLIGVLNKSFGH